MRIDVSIYKTFTLNYTLVVFTQKHIFCLDCFFSQRKSEVYTQSRKIHLLFKHLRFLKSMLLELWNKFFNIQMSYSYLTDYGFCVCFLTLGVFQFCLHRIDPQIILLIRIRDKLKWISKLHRESYRNWIRISTNVRNRPPNTFNESNYENLRLARKDYRFFVHISI